ncbi:MADS-box protein SVP-like [Eucalyptus grandis]|uniref:MADS-box protein SVP-like n=1 Tax=Eucalyptus grandis TaxID=71139 RepID=UPI00192F0404|nr:MADS-box protein SVP-like [Eucalyptus grandis]
MARKKVKLAYIENESARKSSLKKRRQGLLKKARELSILCGVETCAIVWSPDENEPATWPTSPVEVEDLLTRYLSIPEIERSRKMVNQETYLRERNHKLTEQHKKLDRKNKDLENHYLMQQLYLYEKTTSALALDELKKLLSYVEEKIVEIERRIEYIERRDSAPQSGGAPLAVEGPADKEEEEETTPRANIGNVGGDGSGGGGDASSWDDWFSDMMKQSGHAAGSSSSKRETSYPLAYSTGGAGTSSHDVAINLPQGNVGVGSGNQGHGGGPIYGGDNYPMMPYQGYVGDMSGGLPVRFAPGSGIGGAYGYAMGPPYQWEVGRSSSGYGPVFPYGGVYRSNTNIINAAMQPQENPGGMNSGQGMSLPVATGGASGMGVYQRNHMVAGVPMLVPPPGNANTSSAEYGFGVNQGNAAARSQGGGHGGYGVVMPPGNTGNELWMPPDNAGADAGRSGGSN